MNHEYIINIIIFQKGIQLISIVVLSKREGIGIGIAVVALLFY